MPDRDAGFAAAAAWAQIWELPVPLLLRHGMNSLYLCGDVVLRVGATTAPAIASHRLAAWLSSVGVPTLHPVEGLAADAAGLSVTGWEHVRPTRQAVDWEAVGEAVRVVHSLAVADVPPEYPVADPGLFPWWRFDELFADVRDDLDAEALESLAAAVERGSDWAALAAEGAVVCHGDVHPGNVLMSSRGALLVDWDLMCVANPAWDHAMLTTFAERWGGDAEVYGRFAHGYGRSLADDQLVRMLAELRNVAATLMRVQAGRTDPAARAEAERRLRFWRGDPEAPVWRAQ